MDNLQALWQNKHVTGFRRLMYIVSPNETSFETLDEVPQYVNEAAPYFLISVALEQLILLAKGRKPMRPNDSFNSIAHGLLNTFHGLLFRGVELAVYVWVYQHFCICPLPWDSAWTWLAALLLVDLGYYWVHRCGHEVNIMWAGHQTHHSSEDYNLSTALRQSAIHRYVSWMFYMPLALFIPPTHFLVHNQFNLLYQFWIHTELVNGIGPLEYILNTPSHHRVHHGRNPYCIDKNYAGVFIIWDRLFGTFEPEGEKVVYGLVHPLTTWDPLYGQFCHLLHIIRTAREMDSWRDKLSVVFKGPGWEPGKPRLGNPEDLPQIEYPVKKYNSTLPWWGSLYVWMHFLMIIAANSILGFNKQHVSAFNMVAFILFAIFSLTSFGALFDNKTYAPAMEFLRCVVSFGIAQLYQPVSMQLSTAVSAVYLIYLASAVFWGCLTVNKFQFRVYHKKVE